VAPKAAVPESYFGQGSTTHSPHKAMDKVDCTPIFGAVGEAAKLAQPPQTS